MSEIYYEVALLFQEERDAVSLFDRFESCMKEADHELIKLVNLSCEASLDLHGSEYDIERHNLFRNEIRINTYTGRSSETPIEIIAPLKAIGCEMVRISALHEDTSRWVSTYFVGGKKTSKKNYEQLFKKYRIEDETDQLQRFLMTGNFKKASDIVDQCDLARLVPEADSMLSLIGEREKYDDLAIKLVRSGLFDKADPTYKLPWITCVAESGSAALLEACLDRGMDPYAASDYGQYTTIHSCLSSHCSHSVAKAQLIIDACGDNLNPVTKQGSPLWCGFGNQGNIAGCLLLRDAGARVIPPDGFYSDLDRKATIIEATKHCDFEVLKQNYLDEDYHDVVYYGLRYQSYDIIKWIDEFSPIQWESKNGEKADLSQDDNAFFAEYPLYEIPLAHHTDGPGFDARLIDFIIDHVKSSTNTYSKLAVYVAGLVFLPESVELLRKLKSLGANLDKLVKLANKTDKISALDRALDYECLENFEFLLQSGAKPSKRAFNGLTLEERWDYCEGRTRRMAKAIAKKYV